MSCGRRLCSGRSKLGSAGGDCAPLDPSLEMREETMLRKIQAWKSGRRLCSARSKLGKAGGDFAPRDPSLEKREEILLREIQAWICRDKLSSVEHLSGWYVSAKRIEDERDGHDVSPCV